MKNAKQTWFARFLRSELKKAGLSLGAAAWRTGISKSELSLLVNGKRVCRSTMLARLVFKLELDPEEALSAVFEDELRREREKRRKSR